MEPKTKIRNPIITICGHVDHGKTSILDCFRGSAVQEAEAGGITQKISFTLYPKEQLQKACPLIKSSGIKLSIPGFLFIDTPGHAAFTNLRKRGGSLADLAILVIDINEGIKPQTSEVIQILKHNKTPFVIALNKIDNISGWRTPEVLKNKTSGSQTSGKQEVRDDKNKDLKESIESQPVNVKNNFDEKYMTLIASLNAYGFDADLYYHIEDFTKKIALVPCSARTKQGIAELILVLCGLSEKYLSEKLVIGKNAKGVVLEVKKNKAMNFAESILYDGVLSRNDEIAVANFNGSAVVSKIRILEEIEPLSFKFKPKEKITAATGFRMQLVEKTEIPAGMPFEIFKNNKEEIENKFKKEISENIKTDKFGIIAKADSLGSLEALLVMLKQENIPVVKAGIGNINKNDLISAKANLDINELDAVIIGFNAKTDEEILGTEGDVKIIVNEVIYKLIENLVEWRKMKADEIEKNRLMQLASLCKLKILHEHVFRNSNPAIFGVRVEAGKLISNLILIDEDGKKIARVKNIQSENKSVEKAEIGMEIAISLPGTNFERRLKEINLMYSDLSETQFKHFKKNRDLLSENEKKALSEIADIKRKKKSEWGV